MAAAASAPSAHAARPDPVAPFKTRLVKLMVYYEHNVISVKELKWPIQVQLNTAGTKHTLVLSTDVLTKQFGQNNVKWIKYRPVSRNREGLVHNDFLWNNLGAAESLGCVPVPNHGKYASILHVTIHKKEDLPASSSAATEPSVAKLPEVNQIAPLPEPIKQSGIGEKRKEMAPDEPAAARKAAAAAAASSAPVHASSASAAIAVPAVHGKAVHPPGSGSAAQAPVPTARLPVPAHTLIPAQPANAPASAAAQAPSSAAASPINDQFNDDNQFVASIPPPGKKQKTTTSFNDPLRHRLAELSSRIAQVKSAIQAQQKENDEREVLLITQAELEYEKHEKQLQQEQQRKRILDALEQQTH